MNNHRSRASRTAALFVAVLALLALASCSSDDKSDGDSGSTTTAADSGGGDSGGGESAATVAFDKTIQQELADVGCYPGQVDGILGPETDAAILEFQKAAGLEADGELGPETESALSKDAAAGKKVCGTAPSGSTTTIVTTTTSGGGGGGATCTATSIATALPSGTKLNSYVCSEGYAAGTTSSGTFILQAEGAKWVDLGTEPCGGASAGLPPVILETGCPS